MRDRYLFSADRKTSDYKQVLEITPSRARLLSPSGGARQWKWLVSVGILVGWLALTWPASVIVIALIGNAPLWVAALVVACAVVLWFGGLLLLSLAWDRESLLLLADEWTQAEDLVLLGARSFGTFQEVRARSGDGTEFRLIVDARAPRFWEAVRLLEGARAVGG